MVHWNELSDFLKSNPFQTYGVKPLHSEAICRQHVEHFRIFESDVESSGSISAPVPISATVPPPLPPTKPGLTHLLLAYLNHIVLQGNRQSALMFLNTL